MMDPAVTEVVLVIQMPRIVRQHLVQLNGLFVLGRTAVDAFIFLLETRFDVQTVGGIEGCRVTFLKRMEVIVEPPESLL